MGKFRTSSENLQRIGRIQSAFRRFLAVAVMAFALDGFCANDTATKILRAERFQDFGTILRLAHQLVLNTPSELPALTAVLDACVARDCKRNPPGNLRGELVGPQLYEFAQAWIEFSGHNPRRARDRFEALAKHPEYGWFGAYGLLHYAMETENVSLLISILQEVERFQPQSKLIAETAVDALLLLAALTHNYERIPSLLASIKDHAPSHLLDQFYYLIWKDDLLGAKKIIDHYVTRFGYDHSVAVADIELKSLTLPPRQALSESNHTLRKYPRYWGVRMAQVLLLVDLREDAKAKRFLETGQGLPLRFAYVRLQREASLFALNPVNTTNFLKKLDAIAPIYEDYPFFHVTAATALNHINSPEAATNRLEIAEKQNPFYVSAMSQRASIAGKAGKTSEEIDLYRRIANTAPHDVLKKISLVHALYFSKDYAAVKKILAEIRMSKRYIHRDYIDLIENEMLQGLK